MKNSEILAQFLKDTHIYYEKDETEEGNIVFRMQQRIKNGGNATLIILFGKDERYVDLRVFNIAVVDDPLKKEALHKLLNELNGKYRYTKFVEEDGNIWAGYAYLLPSDQLDADELVDMMALVYQNAEQNYPLFMKLQWN